MLTTSIIPIERKWQKDGGGNKPSLLRDNDTYLPPYRQPGKDSLLAYTKTTSTHHSIIPTSNKQAPKMGGSSTDSEEEEILSEQPPPSKKKDKDKKKSKCKEKKSETRSSSKGSSRSVSTSLHSSSHSSSSSSKNKKKKISKASETCSSDEDTEIVTKQPSLSTDDYEVAMRVLAFLQHHKFPLAVKAFEKELKSRNGSIDREAVGAAIQALENPPLEEDESESEKSEQECTTTTRTTDNTPLVEETVLANVVETVDDFIMNSPNTRRDTLTATDGGFFGVVIDQDRPQTDVWDNNKAAKEEANTFDSDEEDDEVELFDDSSSSSSLSSAEDDSPKESIPRPQTPPLPQTPPPAAPVGRKTIVSFNSVVAKDEFEAFSPQKKRDLFYSKEEIDTFKKQQIKEKKSQLKAKALEDKEAREMEIRKAHAKQLAQQRQMLKDKSKKQEDQWKKQQEQAVSMVW